MTTDWINQQQCNRCWHNHSYANGISCSCDCHNGSYSTGGNTYTLPDYTGTTLTLSFADSNNCTCDTIICTCEH